MARKAKVVVPSIVDELVSNEVTNIEVLVDQRVEDRRKGEDVVEVEDFDEEAEIVEEDVQHSANSLLSQALQQIQQDESKVTKVEEVKVKSEKNEGVGTFIKGLISDGLSNKEILSIVHEQYGNKNTTYACVAWYRNKMKKSGNVAAKSSALDFINNFAKSNGLSVEAVEELKSKMKVA